MGREYKFSDLHDKYGLSYQLNNPLMGSSVDEIEREVNIIWRLEYPVWLRSSW